MKIKHLTVLNGDEPTIFSIDFPYIGKIMTTIPNNNQFNVYDKKNKLTHTVMNCSVIIEWE